MGKQSLRQWGRGLLGAAINSSATAVTVMVIDPLQFNIYEGLPKLLSAMAVSAMVGAALYLQQHPLPDADAPGTGRRRRARRHIDTSGEMD